MHGAPPAGATAVIQFVNAPTFAPDTGRFTSVALNLAEAEHKLVPLTVTSWTKRAVVVVGAGWIDTVPQLVTPVGHAIDAADSVADVLLAIAAFAAPCGMRVPVM